jgi:MFS family permease
VSARTAVEATAARDEVALEDSTRTTVLLCAAAFMAMLDLFIVNVVLEPIGDNYPGTSLSGLSWVLNAYVVVYAACLIPAGSLADRWGRKQAFLAGLGVFTLASLGCAAAPTLGFLIASRVLQAAGAAVLTPSSLGLILSVLPVPRRAGAVKIWATSSAFAGALGPGGRRVAGRGVVAVGLPHQPADRGGGLRTGDPPASEDCREHDGAHAAARSGRRHRRRGGGRIGVAGSGDG